MRTWVLCLTVAMLAGCIEAAPDPVWEELTFSKWPRSFEQRTAYDVEGSVQSRWMNWTFDGPHVVVNAHGLPQEAYALRQEHWAPAGEGHGYEIPSHWIRTQWIGHDMQVIREDFYCHHAHCAGWYEIQFPLLRSREATVSFAPGDTWTGTITKGPPLPNAGFGLLRVLKAEGRLAGLYGDPVVHDVDLWYDDGWHLTIHRPDFAERPREPMTFSYSRNLDVPDGFGDVTWLPAGRPPAPPSTVRESARLAPGALFPGSGTDPFDLGFTLDDAWSFLDLHPTGPDQDACIVEVAWSRDAGAATFWMGGSAGGKVWSVRNDSPTTVPVLSASTTGSQATGDNFPCLDGRPPTGSDPWNRLIGMMGQVGKDATRLAASWYDGYEATDRPGSSQASSFLLSPDGSVDTIRLYGTLEGSAPMTA